MKRCLALIMAFIMAVMTGCSFRPAPERVAVNFLDRLVRGNIRSAGRLTADGTLNLDRRASRLYSPLFGSIRYTVNGSVIDGSTARVSVTILVTDMRVLSAEVTAEMTRHMLNSGERSRDRHFYNLLLEKLNSPDAVPATFDATVFLHRERGRWRINLAGSPGFAAAITGGMGEIIGY